MTKVAQDEMASARQELDALLDKTTHACARGHERLVLLIVYELGRFLWDEAPSADDSESPIETLCRRCREYGVVLGFVDRLVPENWWSEGGQISPQPRWRSVEEHTRDLYSDCWVEFDHDSYFREASELLRLRFARNEVPHEVLRGAVCLDAGCGSGRYAAALRLVGASRVIGLDIGSKGLRNAMERLRRERLDGVSFVEGSVLAMPFEDGQFDFVMSNGVLHHTIDPFKGLREMQRVMKRGGTGWLYLYNSDGLYWTTVKAMRRMVESIPETRARETLRSLGVPPNRLFMYMDLLYVPIQETYTREAVEEMLARAGFRSWRFLRRGADRDPSELVARGAPYASEMYGEHGDLRFWLEK